jgi:predicted MFS family arabinose efflux permease
VSRVLEIVAPRRFGTGFRWLLASSWVSNLGDGIAIAAGPLLVASMTHDPFLVALAALLQWLPPLLIGLYAGVLADRLDRRLIVVTVDLLRAAVLVLLTVAIATDVASIALVLLAMFLLGTAEVFADNTSATLLPMLVHRDDLAIANSRLQAGFVVVNQLAGPPIGAALFVIGHAVPFGAEAAVLVLGAVLASRVVLPPHGRARAERRPALHDVAEAFRWVLHHAAVRTLVLTIFVFNITFGAAWSVLVLYATQRLGLGGIGFGLLTTVSALGGLLGTLAYGWITRRVSLGDIMRIGLVFETFTHLVLALTRSAAVAMVIFFLFGAHAFIWGTTSAAVRQRAVPLDLQGRVGSVNLLGVYGGLVIGSGIGGLLARHWGVTAPFWFGFAGSAVFLVLIWGQLSHIAHADQQERPATA